MRDGGSSNGRTADSDSASGGSSPSPPAKLHLSTKMAFEAPRHAQNRTDIERTPARLNLRSVSCRKLPFPSGESTETAVHGTFACTQTTRYCSTHAAVARKPSPQQEPPGRKFDTRPGRAAIISCRTMRPLQIFLKDA